MKLSGEKGTEIGERVCVHDEPDGRSAAKREQQPVATSIGSGKHAAISGSESSHIVFWVLALTPTKAPAAAKRPADGWDEAKCIASKAVDMKRMTVESGVAKWSN
jgi:hypothetical protein